MTLPGCPGSWQQVSGILLLPAEDGRRGLKIRVSVVRFRPWPPLLSRVPMQFSCCNKDLTERQYHTTLNREGHNSADNGPLSSQNARPKTDT